jgi:hypothetical protein
MSTIPRKFFSGALPGRPAATAGIAAVDARALRVECIACARCVFAEHLNKGIFFAKHLLVARSAVAHRCALKMPKHSLTDRFGIHEPPTTGSPIRHRTTRFAQKLRKLFPPASASRMLATRPAGDVEGCDPDSCRRVSHAQADASRGWKQRGRNAVARTWRYMSAPARRSASRHYGNGKMRIAAAETAMPARSDPAGIVCCVC